MVKKDRIRKFCLCNINLEMFISYFDEIGDDGYPKYSSELFVLTSIYMYFLYWKSNYQENLMKGINQLKDTLIKLYELNERYHDTKDNMVWLAISLYAVLSLAIMRILFIKEIQNFVNEEGMIGEILITLFLSLVLYFTLSFINFQYKKKRISIRITEELEDKMTKQVSFNENHLKQFFEFKSKVHKDFKNNKKPCSEYYTTEIPIHVLIFIFFAAQLFLILLYAYPFDSRRFSW